ncbi:hypothetical protein [Aliarcobacter butzleri]|uniref:hypothetical protein n=1 Tax=Aliarcobacter butzleri TaxID=28197 RepID=UPI003AF4CF62
MNILREVGIPFLIGVIIIYSLHYANTVKDVNFKNRILDLDTSKLYSLDNIKRIYSDTYMSTRNINEFGEASIKNICNLIEQVEGNLHNKETKYYDFIIFKIFKKKNIYNNDKNKLLTITSQILDELSEEKKFFGLNTREREILKDLSINANLSEADKKSIFELKDIVTNRYKELLNRNEQSDRLSKKSMRLGYISLFITFVVSFEHIKNFLLKFLQ